MCGLVVGRALLGVVILVVVVCSWGLHMGQLVCCGIRCSMERALCHSRRSLIFAYEACLLVTIIGVVGCAVFVPVG